MTAPPTSTSFLGTRRGKLTLALLCGVQFLDVLDASIVNVALPSIQHSLHFSSRTCSGSSAATSSRLADSCCSAGELRTCSDAGAYSSPA